MAKPGAERPRPVSSSYAIVVLSPASSCPLAVYRPYQLCHGRLSSTSGQACLIIYDDLSKHAVAYRALSFAVRQSPGREHGDVFYRHSRLLGAAKLVSWATAASSSATHQRPRRVTFRPTSHQRLLRTDGQIFLETELFHSGIMPAIQPHPLSRVGGNAQIRSHEEVAGTLKLIYSRYREARGPLPQFGFGGHGHQARLARANALWKCSSRTTQPHCPWKSELAILYTTPS